MWNNQKQQKVLFSFMSNLQTYFHLKPDLQKWTNIQGESG